MCVSFLAEKDFRIGNTCVSSLTTPKEALAPRSLPPHSAIRELRSPTRWLSSIGFQVTGLEDRGVRKREGILRSTLCTYRLNT